MRPMSTIWDEFDAGSWKKVLDRRKFFKSRVEGKKLLCIVVVVLFKGPLAEKSELQVWSDITIRINGYLYKC